MKIHQYRSKALLADYAIPVLRGSVAAAFARAGRIAQIPALFESDPDTDAVVLIG